MNKKEKQRIETRTRLIQIARTEFSRKGFAQTALEDVVKKGGLTRGALYHQFKGKKELFEAVFEKAQSDLVERINKTGHNELDIFAEFKVATFAFIDFVSEDDFRQIILIDGPSVLGWARWREIDAEYSFKQLRQGIDALLAEKVFKDFDADALSTLLSGSLNEAAITLANAKNRKTMVTQMKKNWFAMLEKLAA